MNRSNIEKLKFTISNSILPLINNDYVLLDVPHHHNIGDTLIWQGEKQMLKNITFKCLEESSIHTFNGSKITDSTIILFQGGGNWGDIWPAPHNFRKEIIKKFPNNKIIIFPQSIHYNDKSNLQNDIEFFKGRKNITFCVRDHHSFDLSKEYFPDMNIILVPDMAFYLYPLKMKCGSNKSNRILYLKRNDKEYKEINITIPSIAEEHDWPTFEKFPSTYIYLHRIVKIMQFCRINNNYVNTFKDYYWNKIIRPQNIRIGINFISKYSTIYSTRLHVSILSFILGKKVYILDNSYRKNLSLYETWLEEFDNIKTIDEL